MSRDKSVPHLCTPEGGRPSLVRSTAVTYDLYLDMMRSAEKYGVPKVRPVIFGGHHHHYRRALHTPRVYRANVVFEAMEP